MNERKKYEKPTVESHEIAPGVYGDYGQGIEVVPPAPRKTSDLLPSQE
ncbi:MAG: hypothetical protein ACYDIE_04445 [Candidatus Krumholzibacteriia bacterium]